VLTVVDIEQVRAVPLADAEFCYNPPNQTGWWRMVTRIIDDVGSTKTVIMGVADASWYAYETT